MAFLLRSEVTAQYYYAPLPAGVAERPESLEGAARWISSSRRPRRSGLREELRSRLEGANRH